MDIISYSYADKQSKRITKLYSVGEIAPAGIEIGHEWYKPSVGKLFKRIYDGNSELWMETAGGSSVLSSYNEEYVIGIPKNNYTGERHVVKLTDTMNASFIEVHLNGVLLSSSDYGSDGSEIIFTTDPQDGDVVTITSVNTFNIADVYSKAQVDSKASNTRRHIIEVQEAVTTFPIPGGYTKGNVDVFLNGSKLVVDDDFTHNNLTDIILTEPAFVGDTLEVVVYEMFDIANTYTRKQVDELLRNQARGAVNGNFIETSYNITQDYSIPEGKSAMIVGDANGIVNIANGVIIDIPHNSKLEII